MVERSYLLPKSADYSLQQEENKMHTISLLLVLGLEESSLPTNYLQPNPDLKVAVFEAGTPS